MTDFQPGNDSAPHPASVSRGNRVLTLNGGSSSLKFALYYLSESLIPELTGKIDRIGLGDSVVSFDDGNTKETIVHETRVTNHQEAVNLLFARLEKDKRIDDLIGVGHRVVHGGSLFNAPQAITPEMLRELNHISPFSPEHLPAQIRLIEAVTCRYGNLPQIACFDTAFHSNMPKVARLLSIPRRFFLKGIQRYGFHGLSYEYLLEELRRRVGPKAANGRVILAHLGNGASLAAVLNGQSIDTSMGFTPTAGLPMSTRTGDLDPGVILYLTRQEGLTWEEFNQMVNRQSGLLGVSETSPDLRDLLARQNEDPRAADAVEFFCYHAKKWIGSFAAVLGGVDTLVFSGGIGENAAEIRERICSGLNYMGIQIDPEKNRANADVISVKGRSPAVRVIRTNEEQMIARAVCRILRPEALDPVNGADCSTSPESIS